MRNCASRSAVSSADRCRATSDNTANAKCFAAIRAIATVVADTQEESRSKVCVENGPEEDYEKEYSVVVEVASALAVAKEFANACEDDELRSSSESYREAPCLRGKRSLTRGAACVVANEACTVSLPLSLPAWQVRLALWRCLCRYLCGEAARLACMAEWRVYLHGGGRGLPHGTTCLAEGEACPMALIVWRWKRHRRHRVGAMNEKPIEATAEEERPKCQDKRP